MLAVRPSQVVCANAGAAAALGLYVTGAVEKGAVIAAEQLRFLSALSAEVDARRHNSRFAWSLVDNILRALPSPSPSALQALVTELTAARYARGLGDFSWDDADDARALALLAGEYAHEPELVRTLYDLMATNAWTAQLKAVRCRVEGLERDIVHLIPDALGFYPLFSRINHACEANATLEIPTNQPGALIVRARRALAADEEVTVNYLEPEANNLIIGTGAATLRPRLWRELGFRCSCARCRGLCSWLECAAPATQRCPCRGAAYCSKEHQRLDWPRHKREGKHTQ